MYWRGGNFKDQNIYVWTFIDQKLVTNYMHVFPQNDNKWVKVLKSKQNSKTLKWRVMGVIT